MEGDVTLRYRIDVVLQVVQRLPKRVQMGLISRLKILSKLDISEKRMPQDGRFAVTLEGKPIDFRVSTVVSVGAAREPPTTSRTATERPLA